MHFPMQTAGDSGVWDFTAKGSNSHFSRRYGDPGEGERGRKNQGRERGRSLRLPVKSVSAECSTTNQQCQPTGKQTGNKGRNIAECFPSTSLEVMGFRRGKQVKCHSHAHTSSNEVFLKHPE